MLTKYAFAANIYSLVEKLRDELPQQDIRKWKMLRVPREVFADRFK